MNAATPRDTVAIVGMAARFPGAENVEEYWRNLAAGHCSLVRFDAGALSRAGVSEDQQDDERYVPVRGVLPAVEVFDAELFSMSAREAQLTDPQHRITLECALSALEDAGYDPTICAGSIGVFAGTSMNTYLTNNVHPNIQTSDSLDALMVALGNEKDHFATRIAYRLGLRGPAVTVQTACSTSLVAVHLAYQSLLTGDTDIAIAGGVCVEVPQETGYRYSEQGILSPDGRCRAFDRAARGTVPGNGVGLVVLKRTTEAIADGDYIRAVIRGSAINNDGSAKMGYTAPSVSAQAAVIRRAHRVAGVDPSHIDYVETHGTGTEIGDAIEVAALIEAFAVQGARSEPCRLGSVKPNIGHLDTAAGVAGLIKLVLALQRGQIPPSIDCSDPNPDIPFCDGPFAVNTELRGWPKVGRPRVGAVSSFGIGGTNVHMVVEEAPEPATRAAVAEDTVLLPISAHSRKSLEEITGRLAAHLRDHKLRPDDVQHTLRYGRVQRRMRCAAVWNKRTGEFVVGAPRAAARRTTVAMLFPGQGSQYGGMAGDLYRGCESFRTALEECMRHLEPDLGGEVRDALLASDPTSERRIDETWLTQPALFVTEYSLACSLAEWGIRPAIMLGHSIGEYVAACLAGAFSLRDALALVVARGRLMQEAPKGAMVAIMADEATSVRFKLDGLDLAAVNSPRSHVLAGPGEVVRQAEGLLSAAGIPHRRLPVSHGFHSGLMDPILDQFREVASGVAYQPLTSPVISNVDGEVMLPGALLTADYWVQQLRGTVRFHDGVGSLAKLRGAVLVETGPGHTLAGLIRENRDVDAATITTLPGRADREADGVASFLAGVGAAWSAGVDVTWPETRTGRSVPLPTYRFDGTRHWLEPGPGTGSGAAIGPAGLATGDATSDSVAAKVARFWVATVGGDVPADNTNFFAVGGESLAAIRMLTKIRIHMAIQLSTQTFLESPTFGDLLRAVRSAPPSPMRQSTEPERPT